MATAHTARAELSAAAARGVDLSFRPQGDLAAQARRHSAVLMLFGDLDGAQMSGAPSAPALRMTPDIDVLLTRRGDHMRQHPGQIAFPGGGVEPGDLGNPAVTALREATEETGLNPGGVEILGAVAPLLIPVSNNLVTPVLSWWRAPSPVAPDQNESVAVMRVPLKELLDPAARGTSVLTRGATSYRGAAFQLPARFGGHLVWGFTGMVLAKLFDELGWGEEWDRTREFAVLPQQR